MNLLFLNLLFLTSSLPKEVQGIGIDQRLGVQIPLDLEFRDEQNQKVQLGRYFGQGKPVILAPVYYGCPMLCTQVINGLIRGLKPLKFSPGNEFTIVAFSFDPNDTPELAAKKKKGYVEQYRKGSSPEGWHFLTGSQRSITALTQAIGFRYRWDEPSKQFVHASGVMLLTPDARLSRYFYGIDYEPKDLKFGLMESSQRKIGTPVDQLLLFCFHYDPITGKYGFLIMSILRAIAAATVLALIAYIITTVRRERPIPVS
jgi:protein SCO1/2